MREINKKFNEFEAFHKLEELSKMNVYVKKHENFGNLVEYSKIIFQGRNELISYGTGYFCLKIFNAVDLNKDKNIDKKDYMVGLTVTNVDDMMISAYSSRMSYEKSLEQCYKLAKEFEYTYALDSIKELNNMLRPYGLYATIE